MDNNIPNSAQNTMDIVKISVYNILDALADGEKTTIRDVIDKVVAETKVQISIANGLVPMIVHGWAADGNGTVNAGRSGGIFKGGKKLRVDNRIRCETCNQVIRQKTTT